MMMRFFFFGNTTIERTGVRAQGDKEKEKPKLNSTDRLRLPNVSPCEFVHRRLSIFQQP